jgi:hypothetical protein
MGQAAENPERPADNILSAHLSLAPDPGECRSHGAHRHRGILRSSRARGRAIPSQLRRPRRYARAPQDGAHPGAAIDTGHRRKPRIGNMARHLPLRAPNPPSQTRDRTTPHRRMTPHFPKTPFLARSSLMPVAFDIFLANKLLDRGMPGRKLCREYHGDDGGHRTVERCESHRGIASLPAADEGYVSGCREPQFN